MPPLTQYSEFVFISKDITAIEVMLKMIATFQAVQLERKRGLFVIKIPLNNPQSAWEMIYFADSNKIYFMLRLQAIGNLGKDCVTSSVSGRTVMNFSIAHTEKFKDAQGVQKEKTTWVECAYWSEKTGIAPYLKKGQQVYVEGNPELRSYTKNDGTNGASLTLRVTNIQLLGGNPNRNENGGGSDNAAVGNYSQNRPVAAATEMESGTDDLPF